MMTLTEKCLAAKKAEESELSTVGQTARAPAPSSEKAPVSNPGASRPDGQPISPAGYPTPKPPTNWSEKAKAIKKQQDDALARAQRQAAEQRKKAADNAKK